MYFRCLSVMMLMVVALAARPSAETLRVCADPNNMPFSNQERRGFENEIAELVAGRMNAKLEYTWWSERKGFVKHSLGAGMCDAVMGLPEAMAEVLTTKPYYRSSYVFASRADRRLDLKSLIDPKLQQLRIGVHVVGDDYAPPAAALARRGITKNVTGFSLFGREGVANPADRLLDAVENGSVDVALVWGPFAGFYAKHASAPLDIRAVMPRHFEGIPLTYGIAAGVRPGDEALRNELDRIFAAERGRIEQILQQFGVPEVF